MKQAERFITILDDLSYAKTFYPQVKPPNGSTHCGQPRTKKFIRTRKEKYNRLWQFWKTELPLTCTNTVKYYGLQLLCIYYLW